MRTALRKAFIAACAVLGAVSTAAQGQNFPNRTITLICPWPAGGSTDIHLRKLAELVSKQLGQPVIVENKPGGSGMNGPVTMSKTARPDGYTISQLVISAFRVPHMQKVDWDPLADFTYHLMQWFMPVSPSGAGVGSLIGHENDPGIPAIDDYIAAYAGASMAGAVIVGSGREIPPNCISNAMLARVMDT